MKKLLMITVSSLLSLSSVALAISSPANAINLTVSPTTCSSDTLVAGVYCEWVVRDGVLMYCCIDDYGNWECRW